MVRSFRLVDGAVIIGRFSTQIQRQFAVPWALLLLAGLACGPLDRLQASRQPQPAEPTGAVTIRESSQLAATAYDKLQTLPGYQLESRHIVRHDTVHPTTQVVIKAYDAKGNTHTQTQASGSLDHEFYFVDGHTFLFAPQYEAWIDAGAVTPAEVQPTDESSLADSMHLLTQIKAAPTKSGHEMLNNRPATRYRLEYVLTEMNELFGRELAGFPIDVRGTLWIDDETGALLKSEILLYERDTTQPTQEFVLEISQINDITPIEIPSPLVDPAAIAAATATAQAWTILQVALDYQGEQLSFEVIPLHVHQVPDSSPRSAEVQIILRQLPDDLFSELEPFLAQLREQLTLSIPNRNLIVTSSGYRLEKSSRDDRLVDVVYLFNADLEEFGHAELIISGWGNPIFAPVPVEGNER